MIQLCSYGELHHITKINKRIAMEILLLILLLLWLLLFLLLFKSNDNYDSDNNNNDDNTSSNNNTIVCALKIDYFRGSVRAWFTH